MTHTGRSITRDVAEAKPETAQDRERQDKLEKQLVTGREGEIAREVDAESERIARLLADGKLDARDVLEAVPALERQLDGLDPEFYGDDWDGYDPLSAEEDAYLMEEDGVVEVGGVRDDIPIAEGYNTSGYEGEDSLRL
ncbi:MAG: hypothetical protein ABEJ75_02270 [Candidatus Nanohaloarchaea archaeon]